MANTKNSETAKKKKLILWLKIRAYINPEGDQLERWEKGIYSVDKVPVRLKGGPSSVLEVFEGKVPPRKLTEMANWCGIMHPEDYSDEELLAKMVSEPKPI